MELVVRAIPGSPYFDVVDVRPKHATGTWVIRASYCTKPEAELFCAAPDMKSKLAVVEPRLAYLENLWVVRVYEWVIKWSKRHFPKPHQSMLS